MRLPRDHARTNGTLGCMNKDTRVAHLRMSGIYRELGDGRQAAEHEAAFRRLR
jgi:hypothetical protein